MQQKLRTEGPLTPKACNWIEFAVFTGKANEENRALFLPRRRPRLQLNLQIIAGVSW
jgi:hypothetical protein